MSSCEVDVEYHISPRMLCPCGKTMRAMTEGEREEYDNALRRLAEERAKETNTGTGESTESDASKVVHANRPIDSAT